MTRDVAAPALHLHPARPDPPAVPNVTRACPLCGGAGGSVIGRDGPWQLVQCGRCQLAYLPEIPAAGPQTESSDWEEAFRRERVRRWVESPIARLVTAAVLLLKPRREARMLRRVRSLVPRGRFLDIGAGDGRLAAEAQRGGYDVFCIEPSAAMAAKAARRVGAERVHVGLLDDCPLPPRSFDVVTLVSVLEHEPRPVQMLARVRELLRDGGGVAVKVPNFDCWLRRLRGRRWSGYRWPEHVQYFTPQTLTAVLERAGFEVQRLVAPPWSDNFWVLARPGREGG